MNHRPIPAVHPKVSAYGKAFPSRDVGECRWLAIIPKAAKDPAIEGDGCSAVEARSASAAGAALLPIANDPLKINQLISCLL